MIDDGSTFKLIVHSLVIFVSMAITLAHEFLSRFGIGENMFYLYSLALLLVAMLMRRHVIMQGFILGAVLMLSAPDPSLDFYNVQRDILLSMICAGILLPIIFSSRSKKYVPKRKKIEDTN